MRNLFLFLLPLFLFSCATGQIKQNKNKFSNISHSNFFAEIAKRLSKGDSFEKFERSFPKSELILHSTVVFEKKNRVFFIDDNVTDFALGENEIILLKHKSIKLVNHICNGFLLNDKNFSPERVDYSNGFIAVIGKRKIKIFSLSQCGLIYMLPKKWKYFLFNSKYYFFSNGKNFEVYKYGENLPIMRGNFANIFISGNFSGNKLRILDSNGQILIFDLSKLDIDKVVKTGYKVKKGVIFKNSFIYLTTDNEIVSRGKILLKQASEVLFSKNTSHFYFDKKFFINDANDILQDNVSSFAVRQNLIFFLRQSSLFAVFTKKTYVKSIRFKSPKIFCSCKGNRIEFSNFNGILHKVNLKKHKCSDCTYKEGNFVNEKGEILYKFSNIISKKNSVSMFKRVENNAIFYYFEKFLKKR